LLYAAKEDDEDTSVPGTNAHSPQPPDGPATGPDPSPPRAAAPVEVEVATHLPDWGGFLASRPDADLLHDPRWGQVMQRAYGHTPYYLTARRGGEVVGALQLVHQKSLLFGSHLCSLPYFDAAGVLAACPAAAEAMAQACLGLLHRLPAAWAELRHVGPVVAAAAERTDKLTLRLPLPADPEALWEGLKAKVRNQVRKAEREGLSCAAGGAELLREFHAVYARNMRDLGSPPHGRRFFAEVLRAFPAESRLFVVRLGGRAAAASFSLADPHALRVPWAASDWRLRQLNANMLLYWSMLADGCRRGAPCFDFGRSSRDSGTHRFKQQWGPEEIPLCWQYVLPEGAAAPALRPDSAKYRLLAACWRRLPVFLAKALGPRIVSGLS